MWKRLRKAWDYSGAPWEAVIVGEESGTVTHLPFARFRTKAQAEAWAEGMNGKRHGTATHYEVRQRPWCD